MPVFVMLSLAVAVMVAAVVVLAAVQLWRATRRVLRVAGSVRDRLAPLTGELRDEIAVTQTEATALADSVSEWRRLRAQRRGDREGLRKGLRRTVRGH